MELDDDIVQLHLEMLNDRTRSLSFINSINETVKPGDIVVDIGTGTGILAMAAVKAGAKHVYAIEAGKIHDVTREIIKRNKLDKKITLIHGLSSKVELPELADVLVTETIGHEALAEDIVGIVSDARKRFLKPGAAIIPQGIKIYALPVSLTPDQLESWCFTDKVLRKWNSWYGMDFSPLENINSEVLVKYLVNPLRLQQCKQLAASVQLIEVDLYKDELNLDSTQVTTSIAKGNFNGVVIFFKLQLSRGISFSAHPCDITQINHWNIPVWVSAVPIPVDKGDRIRIKYKYDITNDYSFLEVDLVD